MYQPITYQKFQEANYIPNLDGLRGISIVLVMFHHIPWVSLPFLRNFQLNGRYGVYLFFAISGFLITQLALKEQNITKKFSIKNFYIRRSLRIFPLYYVVLIAACILIFGFNVYTPERKKIFSEKLLSYIFYYSNLTGPIGGPFSLLWSLAVEEQFYLFFSLIFFLFPRSISKIIFFCLTILQLSMPLLPSVFYRNPILFGLLYYQGAILLGASFAYLFQNPFFYEKFKRFFGTKKALLLITGLLTLYFFIPFSNSTIAWSERILNILIVLLVVICAIFPPLYPLEGTFLSHIGKISYGIYLLHTIVFYGIKHYISTNVWIVIFLGVPLTIGLATLSYNYYEAYFLHLKKKFTKNPPKKHSEKIADQTGNYTSL